VTLVDSNVLIDIMTDDQRWYAWSFAQMEAVRRVGPIYINEVVYAECSIGYVRIEDFATALSAAGVHIAQIPQVALFRAGKVFGQYRRSGGLRTGVLPDFFIGAHAEAEDWPLLTRDTRRYRHYFPTVKLIAPE
jgi:predicted nucleic acid-binding protein